MDATNDHLSQYLAHFSTALKATVSNTIENEQSCFLALKDADDKMKQKLVHIVINNLVDVLHRDRGFAFEIPYIEFVSKFKFSVSVYSFLIVQKMNCSFEILQCALNNFLESNHHLSAWIVYLLTCDVECKNTQSDTLSQILCLSNSEKISCCAKHSGNKFFCRTQIDCLTMACMFGYINCILFIMEQLGHSQEELASKNYKHGDIPEETINIYIILACIAAEFRNVDIVKHFVQTLDISLEDLRKVHYSLFTQDIQRDELNSAVLVFLRHHYAISDEKFSEFVTFVKTRNVEPIPDIFE